MANEDKAREIAVCNDGHINIISYVSAKIMAEWKDQQLKEYLEKRLSYATNIYEKSNHEDYNGGYMDAISEIIKELFKGE